MPIKKSGLLLLLLALSSLSLLLYSSVGVTTTQPVPEKLPANCPHHRCCDQAQEQPILSSWDMLTQIIMRSAA